MAKRCRKTESGDQQSGYDCSFVERLPSDLQTECSICLLVLREPYIVGCCGYRFCRTCIEGIQKCPLCKQTFSSLPDKHLERILNEKIVHCSNNGDGCSWIGKLADLETHLNPPSKKGGCQFVTVNCYHCKELVLRTKISAHVKKCKKVTCTHCNTYEDTPSKMEEHYSECPMYPVSCPNNCGAQPLRKNITKHINDSCPKALIECQYKSTGCGVMATRRDMANHGDTEYHLLLALMKITQLEEENASLKDLLKSRVQTKQSFSMPIRFLKVTNLPPTVNKHMLKCLFGQHGTVENIQLHGQHTAIVKYEDEDDAQDALIHSEDNGLKLKSYQLNVEAMY